MKAAFPFLLLTLAACGKRDPSAEAAANGVTPERLEAAAAQSDPASAAILENAADEARSGNSAASAQGALATAGNATAGEALTAPTNAGPIPPPKQARPNLDGQVRPSPAVVPPNARE